ncbi:CIC11C00000005088 [Sungouiella intermedia]|uniref:CIC11C00000005088 n=1 Tax=Sungouiella intermedia TaxID=45354 RepID=A0A1L0BSM8_9ASCO|nr:CIC11C00000005088 [[Candida] intermedia]
MLRASIAPLRSVSVPSIRAIHGCARVLAKNDSSTIDSFKLPSQTSINEWEFKYDFVPKVAQPKIPPVSPEAVKQDIAQTKKQQVETELFNKELNSSVKVEANNAAVVSGGEQVGAEVEYLQDKGSEPVDSSPKTRIGESQPKKTANHDNYVQSSINPEINQSTVVSLDHDKEVDHKTSDVHHAKVVDDVEHDHETQQAPTETSSSGAAKLFAVLGLGGVAGYFWFGAPEKKK